MWQHQQPVSVAAAVAALAAVAAALYDWGSPSAGTKPSRNRLTAAGLGLASNNC